MEKLILLIHGFKKNKKHDFDGFYDYAKDKIDCQMKRVYWFDNYNKKSLCVKSFLTQIDQIMEKNQDKEIIIVSFSMGASIFLTQSYKWNNISDLICIFPTFYISYFGWITKIHTTLKLRKKLRKKLSKDRYKRLLKSKTKSPVEKYPIKLMLSMNELRSYLLKNLGQTTNKNIHIFLNQKDEVNKTKKTLKEIKKVVEPKNIVSYYWINESHYTVMINNPNFYHQIINLLNIQEK